MRYRTFGDRLSSVSALTLRLDATRKGGGVADWRNVVFAALEAGINSFEIGCTSPAMLDGAAQALAAMERRLFVIGWRTSLESDARETGRRARDLAGSLGLENLDLLTLELDRTLRDPAALEDLRRQEVARWLSVSGSATVLDDAIAKQAFDGMTLRLDPAGGWNERNRIKAANVRGMGVVALEVGGEFASEPDAAASRGGLLSLFSRRPAPAIGSPYKINVQGWSDQQIAIAHTLTDPCISTIVVQPESVAVLESLVWCVERDLPAGAQAQIEMARFSADVEPQPAQRRRARR